MRSDVIRRLVFVSLLALAFILAGSADGAEEPAVTFTEVAQVTVVNLEVRVTDKKGRPIRGLTADDFEIYEDGRRMELSNFYFVEDGAIAQAAAAEDGHDDAQANPLTDVPRTTLSNPSLTSLSWVVYVDNDAVHPAGRARLLADLREHLSRHVARLDQTTIMVRQGGALRRMMPFGSSPEDLATALESVAAMPAGGRDVESLRRDTYRQVQAHFENWHPMEGDPCVEGAPRLESYARAYAAQLTDHVGRAMSGLRYLSTVLAGVPGRKAVLYVGEGIEQLPGYAMFHFLSDVCPQSASTFQQNLFVYDETDALRMATDHANANNITLYSLQARGAGTNSMVDVSFGDRRYTPSSQVDRLDRDNRQSSLFLLAEETGGKPVLNANQFLAALEDIERDLGTYYSLGYTPPHAGDNKRHVISVKLSKRRPWQVRARRGYVDKAVDVQLAERTVGAARFGFEANPLGVTAEVRPREADGAPISAASDPRTAANDAAFESVFAHPFADAKDAKKTAEVDTKPMTLRLSVDMAKMTLVPASDGRPAGRLRLVLTLANAEGEPTILRQRSVDVRLAVVGQPGARHQVDVGLDLPPGQAVLGIGVRDEIGGVQSFLRHAILVPPI